MDKVISCVQINLQKSKAASLEIQRKDIGVVFITEPHYVGKNVSNLIYRAQTQVLSAGGQHRPRAALRVAKDLDPWLVSEFSDSDMCAASIKIGHPVSDGTVVNTGNTKRCVVCSLYLDILLDTNHQKFLKLIDWCERERMPLVVGMDSNAHSPLWGSDERNTRGEQLEDLFLAKNLLVLNTGSTPTFQTNRSESVIDVTVANSWAMQTMNLEGWRVADEQSFSDHRYISFSMGKYVPKVEEYRNLRKADWDLFQSSLSVENLPVIEEDGKNLDLCALELQTHLIRALDVACPLRKALNKNPNPWWSAELDQIRSELRELCIKRKRSEEDEHAFRSLRKLYTKRICRAKRKSWQDFCTKAETVKEVSKIMKILRPKTVTGMSLFTNQQIPLTPKETLENLMDTHFIDSVPADEMMDEAVPVGIKDDESNDVIEYIDEQKVAAAMASFGPQKAPGPDGLKPLVLQKLPAEYITYLCKLYKMAVGCRYTPKVWRQMRVVFIPKEGKADYGVAKSYRPITLSNFLLKGLERLVQWYINERVLSEPLYAQHAYTVGRSCDTAVSEVVDFIEKNTYRKQHVLAVSLDCTGAFDRIKFESADEAMKVMSIPDCIRMLYKNILEGRQVTAELQGEKSVRKPKRGSPQGGVLSPLIFILIMNIILSIFSGTAVKVVGYADDIILLIAGKDPSTLVELMNAALLKVSAWGHKNGLMFNPSKTQAVRFSQCRKFSAWKSVKMDGTEVKYADQMKYLGVVLHRLLLWRPHCHERIRKATKTINSANAVIGQKWGFSPEKALWVYTAMARSVSTYGALVWANTTTGTIRMELARLQRKAMLGMTASMRSTPTAGMEVVLGLLPLELHARELAVSARLRTRSLLTDGWDGIGNSKKGHRKLCDTILDKIPAAQMPSDRMTNHRVWMENDEIEDPDITLFTDGSKMDDRSGAGWAACHGDTCIAEESVYLGKKASVFQAEVVAIERALGWARSNLDPGTKILIRSDSQSAIQALLRSDTISRVVDSCKRMMLKAKENLRIALRWIKGHADFTGNELADHLARLGACLDTASVEPELPVPTTEVKRGIKDHYQAEWQKLWDSEVSCRQTKIFVPKVNGRKIKKLAKYNRKDLNLLVQACTGHALVAHHVNQWVAGLADECQMCLEDEESTAHLFFDCPALWQSRTDIKSLQLEREKQVLRFFSSAEMVELLALRARSCNERL